MCSNNIIPLILIWKCLDNDPNEVSVLVKLFLSILFGRNYKYKFEIIFHFILKSNFWNVQNGKLYFLNVSADFFRIPEFFISVDWSIEKIMMIIILIESLIYVEIHWKKNKNLGSLVTSIPKRCFRFLTSCLSECFLQIRNSDV